MVRGYNSLDYENICLSKKLLQSGEDCDYNGSHCHPAHRPGVIGGLPEGAARVRSPAPPRRGFEATACGSAHLPSLSLLAGL